MADEANPQVRVTLTAEDAGLSSALKSLSDELKRLDSQQTQSASTATRAARTMGEATGGIRSQIGLLDNTIRGAHAQAMADLVRRFSDSAVVMNLLPIGATAGAFVLLGGIIADLVRKFEELKNSQSEIAQAEQKLQTQSNETMGKLGDEVLRARMEVDRLSGNSLRALREQLALIDHTSMGDLISQFSELNKYLLAFLKPLEGHWYEPWDKGSDKVEHDMTQLQAKIGEIKSEMGLLDPASKQYRDDQAQLNKLLDDAVAKYKKIVELQKQAVDRKSTRLNSSHYSRSRMPSSG